MLCGYICRKADQLLQELKQPQAYSSPLSMSLLDYSSSILEISGTPSTAAASDSKLTLRVRCRGKIHRFTVNKVYTCTLQSAMSYDTLYVCVL